MAEPGHGPLAAPKAVLATTDRTNELVKHETFPTIAQALLLLLALILLEVLVYAVLGELRHGLDLNRSERMAFTTLLGNGLVFATLLHWKSMPYRTLFNPSGASFVSSAVLVGIPVAATVPFIVLSASAVQALLTQVLPLSVWEERAFDEMAAQNLAAVTSVCLLAPVLEEMLFRGLILRSFLAQYQRSTAIGASALLFGVAHLNIYQLVTAFFLGLFLGWLYDRVRSLVPCIVLHATYNTAVTVLGMGYQARASDAAITFETETWIVAVALGALGAYVLYRVLGPATRPDNDRLPN